MAVAFDPIYDPVLVLDKASKRALNRPDQTRPTYKRHNSKQELDDKDEEGGDGDGDGINEEFFVDVYRIARKEQGLPFVTTATTLPVMASGRYSYNHFLLGRPLVVYNARNQGIKDVKVDNLIVILNVFKEICGKKKRFKEQLKSDRRMIGESVELLTSLGSNGLSEEKGGFKTHTESI
ncbi:hypothetical protein BY996DRAFT_6426830 [Phakopsora pachyrhizi]|nr:hypothetical protein BY996DRAFT_6426830 [Phakopsora pachyrhizi]